MDCSPLISVITINRNNAAGLRRTLSSMAGQTLTDREHVVIDGASTDGSQDVIQEFGGSLDFWCSEPDTGIYNAMNKGIARARGDFLLFINSGDHLVDANSLDAAVKHLGRHDLCYFDLEVRELMPPNPRHDWVKRYPDTLRLSHFVNDSLPHPACFIRRELFARHGSYDESLKICADWKAFMLWICKHGCTYAHVPKVLSVFYTDGLSSHADSSVIVENERRQVLEREFPAMVEDARDALAAREALKNITALRSSRVVRSLQSAGLLWKF